MNEEPPHLPILRAGVEYESLDTEALKAYRDGATLAVVSRANAALIRRDLARVGAAAEALRRVPLARMLEICAVACEHFLGSELPLGGGRTQTPDEFVACLSATSGIPHPLVRKNMDKIATVLREMPAILRGLTRGLDLQVLEDGLGEVDGMPVSFSPTTSCLGVVLPSNSPGVNSIWMPAVALRTPVILKPGRDDPWTPLRIVRAFLEAGCPPEAFGFYPCDHDGAASLLELCGRSLLFGDEKTARPWLGDPRVEVHGPGRSKVVLGADEAANWREHLDVLVSSVLDGGGRSCINASTIVVAGDECERHADEIAQALAEKLVHVEPRTAADEQAALCAFPNVAMAEWIDSTIDAGLAQGGAEDCAQRERAGAVGRRVQLDGATYLLPTVLRCGSIEHPLAKTEYLFPFVSVVALANEDAQGVVAGIGPSLVVTAITRDPELRERLLDCPHVDRLNIGPIPTTRVEWDQPHEGNLFELLYSRRAIQRAPAW